MRTREEIMGEANAQNMKYKHLEVLLDIRELMLEDRAKAQRMVQCGGVKNIL